MSIWTDASPRLETDAIDKPVIHTVPRKLCVCVWALKKYIVQIGHDSDQVILKISLKFQLKCCSLNLTEDD